MIRLLLKLRRDRLRKRLVRLKRELKSKPWTWQQAEDIIAQNSLTVGEAAYVFGLKERRVGDAVLALRGKIIAGTRGGR